MSHAVSNEPVKNSSAAAFWAILIFIGLLIGAINFVHIESNSSEEHESTEAVHHAPAEAGQAAPASEAGNH